MGLMVHSLNEISETINREYYIYLLDYGWDEPLSRTIIDNFRKISSDASKHNSIFIVGTVGSHVNNEIMSYHHLNGENDENIFPAILITKDNPHVFRKMDTSSKNSLESKIIVIPLKKCCKSETDVVSLIENIFADIRKNKELSKFSILKKMKKGIGRRLLDGVILEPNFSGIGFNLKKFFEKK